MSRAKYIYIYVCKNRERERESWAKKEWLERGAEGQIRGGVEEEALLRHKEKR